MIMEIVYVLHVYNMRGQHTLIAAAYNCVLLPVLNLLMTVE